MERIWLIPVLVSIFVLGISSSGMPVHAGTPPIPTLLSPIGGITINDSTTTFDWTDVVDPDGVIYRLQVTNDPSFSTLVINQFGLIPSTFTALSELPDNTYFWRITVFDLLGNVTPNVAPESFTINTDVPIGGTYIPIDQSALLLAGVQSISMWMIPVVIAGIGIGIFVIKRKK